VLSELQVIVTTGIIIVVAMIALFVGIWYGEGRNAELIEDLERELSARSEPMPPEIAHEPAERLRVPVEYRPAQIPGVGTPIWQTPREGFIAVPDWHADETRVDDLDEFVRMKGWDLEQYVQGLIEQT
jgi:hypothetical protein